MTTYLVLLIGLIAASSASILIRLCDAPSLVIASYRLALSSLFFVTLTGVKRNNPLVLLSSRDLWLAALSGLFLSLHFAAWITSLNYTSVANSVVLVSTTPIFVAVGSALFLKEQITKLVKFGIVLTVLGTLILGSGDLRDQGTMLGSGLALSGGVAIAGYFLIGRNLRARTDTTVYVTVVYSTAAVLLVLVTMALKLPFFDYNSRTLLLLFLIAIVPQIVGHTSFNWALKHVSATMVAMITLGEPIGAPVLAFIILGETITGGQALGGFFILSGLVLAIRGEAGTG